MRERRRPADPHRLRRELTAALQLSRALSQHADVEQLVERALRTALEVVGADAGSVLLANPDTKELVFRHVVGEKADLLLGQSIPWDQGIAGTVFTTGKPYLTGDASRDRRHLRRVDERTGFHTRDMIALPLKQWEGTPVGVLEILNKRSGRLGDEDLGILTIISSLTAAAIEQARLFEDKRLAEVGRLLGNVGHDVSNLLTPVICGVRMLETNMRDLFKDLSDRDVTRYQDTRELFDSVMRLLNDNMRRIQDMVREMADAVKGSRSVPRFAACRLGDVADAVLKTLLPLALQQGIELRQRGLAGCPAIEADERRLYIALYNLVNNAIAEVPHGGSVTVAARADAKAGIVRLDIADTGRGMPPDVRDSLFTDRAISRKPGGTGLGTKIVKDVVDAHRGRITVTSTERKGTTVHIVLPLRQPKAPESRRGRSILNEEKRP
jgi:signal transduction histidine kinase